MADKQRKRQWPITSGGPVIIIIIIMYDVVNLSCDIVHSNFYIMYKYKYFSFLIKRVIYMIIVTDNKYIRYT